MIEVDPRPVDRTLRDVKAHLALGFPTRRRRGSGRGERLRGVIDYRGLRERLSVRIRVHLAFLFCKLRFAVDARDGQPRTVTAVVDDPP